ncbi:MAG: hypothetical protein Q8P18_04390 [Pseudomonadota bacterium]|nr:hypothetical protein [Pseudomonadota bacterium]
MDLGRFFAPDLDAAELPELEQALAQTGRVRHGGGLRLRGNQWRADRDGPHCERLFGPLHADRCMCGRLVGPEHRGERCDRCGVEVGDPAVRATRWGHVACRVGVAHPTLLARAVEELGLGPRPLAWPETPYDEEHDEAGSLEELLEDEDDLDEDAIEAPPAIPLPLDALEERVATSLRVHHIPVSPPTGRVGPALPRGLLPTPNAEELAVARLVGICGRLDRLDELQAPPVILAMTAESAADALAALFAARRAPALPRLWTGDAEVSPPVLTGRRPPDRARDRHATHIDGLAFWGESLLSTGRAGLRVTSLHTGRSRRIPAGPCHLLGVVGNVAVFDGLDPWPLDHAEGRDEAAGLAPMLAQGYAALDLDAGRWLTALPGAPRIRFGQDQPEDGWAEEVDTGRAADLHIASDRPAFGAYTPALDAMLVLADDTGPLIDGATGLALLDIGAFTEDCARIEGGRRVVQLAEGRGGPPAVVHLGGRRWRILLPGGAVGEIDEAGAVLRWALRRPHSAAAFSPNGARLAVAEGRRVRVLDAGGVVLRTIDESDP